MGLSRPELITQLEERAQDERDAGSTIDINHSLEYVAIDMADGSEYFFQGQEATELLDDVPEWIDEETYLLAMAQSW